LQFAKERKVSEDIWMLLEKVAMLIYVLFTTDWENQFPRSFFALPFFSLSFTLGKALPMMWSRTTVKLLRDN